MTEPALPPRLNQAVHYRSFGTPHGEYSPQCRAATVTEVGGWVPYGDPEERQEDGQRYRLVPQRWDPDACALLVANPDGMFLKGSIRRHEPPAELLTFGDASERMGRQFAGGTWHSAAICER